MNVAVLISNERNWELLASLLAGIDGVVPRRENPFGPDVDMLIVDSFALALSSEEISRAKAAADPLFLPVLFIAPSADIAKTATGDWSVVDDVAARPLVKRELEARIRTLLRARSLALRLAESVSAYEREHTIATTLQRAALPNELPDVPGFAFDAFYEPARHEANIGGDWYDAVRLNDGRVVISVGDVAGTGLRAAVTMASMRQAIRAVAQVYADPLTMLDAADRTLKAEFPDSVVTAFVGVVDSVTLTMHYASAGHPPPMVRRHDGSIEELRAQSLPLGLRVRDDRLDVVAQIEPGSLVLFYTDGLSEASRGALDGELSVRAALADDAILQTVHPARAIKDAVFDGGAHEDDVAILAMRVAEAARDEAMLRWEFNSDDAASAARARHEFVAELERLGGTGESLFTCELIFGELIGNVVRYAPGPLEIVLDTGAKVPVMHVLDRGRGFTLVPRLPTDLLSDRGRGLFLIWTLGEDFSVDVRYDGGSHARVVLPFSARPRGRKAIAGRTPLSPGTRPQYSS